MGIGAFAFEAIISTLLGLCSEQLYDKLKNKKLVEKIVTHIETYLIACENKFSGTIIEYSTFHNYIHHFNIITKFLEFHAIPNSLILKTSTGNFIENQISNCVKYFDDNRCPLSVNNRSAIHELFTHISRIIEIEISNTFSAKEAYLLNTIILGQQDIKVHFENRLMNLSSKVANMKTEIAGLKENMYKIERTNSFASQTTTNVTINLPLLAKLHGDKNNSLDFAIRVKVKTDGDPFKLTITVKANDLLNQFGSADKYLDYLSWSGNDGTLDVIKYIITRGNEELFRAEREVPYFGATFQLPTFLMNSIETNYTNNSPVFYFKEMILLITTPKQIIILDILDDNLNKIVENWQVELTRKYLDEMMEVTLKDVRKNMDIKVEFMVLFKGLDVVKTDFRIMITDNGNAVSTIAYYQLQKKFSDTHSIIFRDKQTNTKLMTANISINKGYKAGLNKKIDFYKKLVYIQDEFNIVFHLPDTFDGEDIYHVNEVYNLITKGITRTLPLRITINKKYGNKHELNVSEEYLLSASFHAIVLFGQEITLDDATIIMPITMFEEEVQDTIYFTAKDPCFIVWKKKYGDFDVSKLAKKEVEKYKRIHDRM
jgi:hypothetical protein